MISRSEPRESILSRNKPSDATTEVLREAHTRNEGIPREDVTIVQCRVLETATSAS